MAAPADTLLLFAHGARDPQWRVPVDAMASTMSQSMPEARVAVAFLEFMSPTLGEAIDSAAAAGSQRVSIAPLFWAEGGHLKREVPELIAAAQARHPHLRIDRWPVLGHSPEVLSALAGVYRARWQQG
ncbi:MAG TPA: CbiX/SirB N-terminal domain-containing protein [Burkholderiaceae bacterium]|jgi:sirohydrochlorin cobaltochelatase|nr:CbiX/SirB N-terminal domain-containing protein [Burkholderiaceae bacterium]